MPYRLKFIVSARFMSNSLSNVFINFSEGNVTLNVNVDIIITNPKHVELNKKSASSALSMETLKIIY